MKNNQRRDEYEELVLAPFLLRYRAITTLLHMAADEERLLCVVGSEDGGLLRGNGHVSARDREG